MIKVIISRTTATSLAQVMAKYDATNHRFDIGNINEKNRFICTLICIGTCDFYICIVIA